MKVSRKEGARRLSLLLRKMKQLPKERIGMGVWVGADWEGAPDLSCGTTACARFFGLTDVEAWRLFMGTETEDILPALEAQIAVMRGEG